MSSDIFRVKFLTPSQGIEQAIIQTKSLKILEQNCLSQNLIVIRSSRVAGLFFQIFKSFFTKAEGLILFTQSLQQLLKGGVTLLEALQVLIKTRLSPEMKLICCDLVSCLLRGQSFSQALLRYPGYFDLIYISLIENAESKGNYINALTEVKDYLDEKEKLQKDLQKALTYPILLLTLCLGLMSFLCIFVLPELVLFIQTLGGELPFSTRMLIALSQSYGILLTVLGLVVVVLILLGTQGAVHSERIHYWRDYIILKLPFYGGIFYRRYLCSFFATLAALSQGGQKLPWALELAYKQLPNQFLKQQFSSLGEGMRKGQSFDKALSHIPGIPLSIIKLVQVGLRSSCLTENFILIVKNLNAEIKAKMSRFLGNVQPVLLLGVGTFFLWVVFSIFLPIYENLGALE